MIHSCFSRILLFYIYIYIFCWDYSPVTYHSYWTWALYRWFTCQAWWFSNGMLVYQWVLSSLSLYDIYIHTLHIYTHTYIYIHHTHTYIYIFPVQYIPLKSITKNPWKSLHRKAHAAGRGWRGDVWATHQCHADHRHQKGRFGAGWTDVQFMFGITWWLVMVNDS